MNFKKILAGTVVTATLAVFPFLPAKQAEASTTYYYRYYTNYNTSYSTPVKVNYYYSSPSKTVYRYYYDLSKYNYTPEQPGDNQPEPNQPTTPSQPAQPTQPTQPKNPAPTQPQPTQPDTNVGQISQYEQKVVDLVNVERNKAGLSPLNVDLELSKVARLKSQDMRDKKYFSHTSPTYGSPFEMMKQFGISYRYAGENIAAGQKTPEQVVEAWMNSSGHKANILNGNYTHIGVGYVSGGSYGAYWTQMFIGK